MLTTKLIDLANANFIELAGDGSLSIEHLL